MTLDEYIQKLEAAQKVLPDMISVAAKNATIRAVEAAQEKTPPTADSLSGINTRTGELEAALGHGQQDHPGAAGRAVCHRAE